MFLLLSFVVIGSSNNEEVFGQLGGGLRTPVYNDSILDIGSGNYYYPDPRNGDGGFILELTPPSPSPFGGQITSTTNNPSDAGTFDGGVVGSDGNIVYPPQNTNPSGSGYYSPTDGTSGQGSTGGVNNSGNEGGYDEGLGLDDGSTTVGDIGKYNADTTSGERAQPTTNSGAKDSPDGGGILKIIVDAGKDLLNEIGKIFKPSDPLIFSLDHREACTIKREMGSPDSTYWNMNLYALEPAININLGRSLCDGTYVFGVDRNHNGILDSGYEILWHPHYTAFELLQNLDYFHGNFNGVYSEGDEFWNDVLIMNAYNKYYTPADLGITGMKYWKNVINIEGDRHGKGSYANDKGLSNEHFRIIAYCEDCLVMEDDTTRKVYGALQEPLRDCTIHDIRYHEAERITGLYLQTDSVDYTGFDPTPIYEDSLDYCNDFHAGNANPDKYLSHWVAGVASMQHKKAIQYGEPTDIEWGLKSIKSYEEALSMSPDNPFYNVDYCLLHYQMNLEINQCIPNVEQAIIDRPDVEWFKTVLEIVSP